MASDGETGLDMLRRMMIDEIEMPIFSLVGFNLISIDEGTVTFEFKPSKEHYNLVGTVHGGIIATIINSSMECAVRSRLDANTSSTIIETNINYVRPVTSRVGLMHCDGRVTTIGPRVAMTRAEMTDRRGSTYAYGTGICLVNR